MDVSFLGPFAVFGVGVSILTASQYYAREQRINRALHRTRTTRICDVTDGQVVKIVGRVRLLGEPLEAPISGRGCAYYRVTVRERGATFLNLISEERRVDFQVADETGTALVDAGRAAMVVTTDHYRWQGLFHDPDERMLALLGRYGKRSTGPKFNRILQYQEGVLEGGKQVAVLGLARREEDRLLILAPDGGRVRISDDSSAAA